MVVIENGQVKSDAGKLLRLKGSHTVGDAFDASQFGVAAFDEVESVSEVLPDEPSGEEYGERVNELIRERYSLSEELAILRQRSSKKAEFKEYNDYCEQCKKAAKEARRDE